MRGASLRWLPLLLLASLPALVSSWHASLGKRAAPIVHATSQRGDLELPRAQDVIDDPCLLVTTSVEKLHSVCNATCATAVPCDWNCKVAWNSFLRDAHSVEGMQCPRYAAFLDETPLGDSLVPALGDALMSRAYLMSLIDKCRDACPEGVDDESLFPCGENYDAQQGSSFTRCQLERDPGLTACFPLSPYKAKCTGGPDSFNVTDGEVWYPLVTWGVVAHYKKKNLASTGGLYGTDKSLGLYGTDKSIEINEYSSWACLWEESCEEMRNKRKMSCFKYSHLRGEFIFWKWSDTVVELKNVYVDVWTVFASFCQQGSFLVIDAFDRGVAIEPEGVKYTFNRMHRDGKYRPAFSGLLADFGEDGCGDFELQRDMPYLLQIQVQEREAYSYFTSLEKWNSPTKSEMQALVQLSSDAIPIVIPVFPKRGIECSSLAFVFSWCITSEIDMDIVLFKVIHLGNLSGQHS